MKYWKTALAILAALFASIALADDFKTNDGKEYKNATVTRVEADGIVVRTKGGIIKLYFPELPQDVQERFHYDPEKAAAAQAAAASARRSGSLMKIGATSFSQDLVLELHSSLSVERQMRTHFARMSQG